MAAPLIGGCHCVMYYQMRLVASRLAARQQPVTICLTLGREGAKFFLSY